VEEPLVTGQTSFFGAVMSEQAARTTEATTVAAMSRRRRIIGVSPDRKGTFGSGPNRIRSTYGYQEMPKWHFLIRKCLFPIKNSTFLITSPRAEEVS
jgi:hypothetical protein